MARVQVITIIVTILFLLYISRQIIKGRLREEYSIVWLICSVILLIFSIWRNGLDVMSRLFGIIDPPNLVFTGCIFAILIYLLHLSIVNSKQQKNIANLTQELAILKEKLERSEKGKEEL
jgi:hypothetical protein